MKLPLLRFCLLLLVLGGPIRAWASKVSSINTLGNDTYNVTVEATHKFTRNTDKLKKEAEDAATEYCARDGKVLKIVAVDEKKSMYMMGDFAYVTLTFKALAPSSPEIAQAVQLPDKPTVAPSAETEQLYADLLRLEELRKKGILTDAEFAAEKKKVLDRSK